MTHDELSKKLEGLWHDSYKAPGYMALRAVVELHKPVISQQVKDTYPNNPERMESEPKVCEECSDIWEVDLGVLYPCLTIETIEKGLR
jgi:hypothetical protein